MDRTTLLIQSIASLIKAGDFKNSLKRMGEFEQNNPDERLYKFYKPGFLIDIGVGLKSEKIIKDGITAAELALEKAKDGKVQAYLHYCLANGYTDLFELTERIATAVDRNIPQSENLWKAKRHLMKATSVEDIGDTGLIAQLLVNLGNCLDTLGRSIEAIETYDEAIDINKNFSMAIANKAKALRAFAEISDKYRAAIYVEVYQDIKSVIDNPDLVEVGGQSAKQAFERELQYIESRFQDKSLLKKKLKHQRYKTDDLSDFEKFYLELCQKEKLFLNFHIHQDHCEAAIEDPIFIRLITKVDDDDTFYKFAKYLNQIKEDFAVARLLLVQSQYRQDDFNRISERTSFVYALDYSQFNIYTGLLKSSFKEAFNILDKVAVFVNDYYQLGFREEDIYFNSIRGIGRGASIWQDNGVIRKEILNSENISLYALYDIYRDFQSGEHQRIQDIRNALTHRRLVIYDSGITDWDSKLDKHNIGYNTILIETIQLMKLVKAAIIYLVNFVNVEEGKKRKAGGNPILDMYADTSQFL